MILAKQSLWAIRESGRSTRLTSPQDRNSKGSWFVLRGEIKCREAATANCQVSGPKNGFENTKIIIKEFLVANGIQIWGVMPLAGEVK